MHTRAEFIILARARRAHSTNWWTFLTNASAQVFSPITSITHTRITKTLRKPISRTRGVRSGTSHASRWKKACAITCSGCLGDACVLRAGERVPRSRTFSSGHPERSEGSRDHSLIALGDSVNANFVGEVPHSVRDDIRHPS